MKRALVLILLAGAITGAFVVTSVAASDRHSSYPCEQSGPRHGMMMDNAAPCLDDDDDGMMRHHGSGHMMDGNNGQMTGQRMGHMNMMGHDGGHMMNHRHHMGGDHMMGGMMMGMMNERMKHLMFLDRAKELGLSGDQVAQLKTIHSNCRKDSIRLAADIKIARLELNDALDGTSWTVKEAEPLVRKVQQLQGDLQMRQLQGMSDARQVLTPEQLKLARSGADANLESLFE